MAYPVPHVVSQQPQPTRVTGPAPKPAPKAVKPPKPKVVKVKAHTRKIAPPKASPLDRPVTPGSSLTVREAQRMASNATRVRYGGQEQGINQQIATSGQVAKDQADWYRSYLTQLAQYQQDTQNRVGQTNTAVQQQADSLRALDQGNLTSQQQQMGADAANRGATVDPNVAGRAGQASLVRQALEGSMGSLIAQQGSSAVANASNMAHVVGPIQQGQAAAGQAKSQQALRAQLTALKGTEGAYAQSFIDSLTATEAKNLLAASIAAGKDLTSVTTAKVKAQAGVKTARAKAQAEGGKVNAYGYTNKQWSAMTPAQRQTSIRQFKQNTSLPKSTTPKGGKGQAGLSLSQESHIVQAVKGATAAARRLMGQKGAKSGEVRALLAAGKVDGVHYTADEINAAFDLLPTNLGGLGGLSRANVAALRRMGIHNVKAHFPVVFGGAPSATAKQINTVANGVYGI